MRLLPLLAAALLGTAVLASPASAGPSLEVGVADDRIMLKGTDEEIARATDEWKSLGVDVVRIHALWANHAPDAKSQRMPEGFNAADPNSPGYDWARLDRAIDAVTSRGMRVYLVLTGWSPLWASADPSRGNVRHKPLPHLFAQFATAAAMRFGDRVDTYIVWNEPNLPLWLQPQSTCVNRKCKPYAPHLYRRLYNAAAPAILAADPGARLLAGALAPRGQTQTSANANLRPLQFLRAMGCVDSRWRRAKRTGDCRNFSPVRAHGLAYHPHGLVKSPTQPSEHPDDAQMADLNRLATATDKITRANGLKSLAGGTRMPLYLTEYAYQTNPPDRFLGVSESRQNDWLQQASYMAWQHPRVQALVQYAWVDEPLAGSSSGWQSGLRFADGRPKAALARFATPFWALRRDKRTVRVWGQVRPGDASTVTIERQSGGTWIGVATVQTDARGFFRHEARISSRSRWRAVTSAGVTFAEAGAHPPASGV